MFPSFCWHRKQGARTMTCADVRYLRKGDNYFPKVRIWKHASDRNYPIKFRELWEWQKRNKCYGRVEEGLDFRNPSVSRFRKVEIPPFLRSFQIFVFLHMLGMSNHLARWDLENWVFFLTFKPSTKKIGRETAPGFWCKLGMHFDT